jgi:hypothetical protein
MREVKMMISGIDNVTVTMMNTSFEEGVIRDRYARKNDYAPGVTIPSALEERNHFHMAKDRLVKSEMVKGVDGKSSPLLGEVTFYPV